MTTQHKHTPGPWTRSTRFPGRIKAQRYDVAAVCDWGQEEPVSPENDANARLISAAPDLLEAAEKALAMTERESWGTDRLSVLSQLRAAIAKARGL